jgi:general secretion pathway protein K
MRRGREDGVVLVNVLGLLAVTASVVATMLGVADLSVARSQRFSEAGQALALARAGERSAIVALRRDMRHAPDADHRGEPWADVAQAGITIAGGDFELAIEDAQGRFNLNTLIGGGLQAAGTFRAIAAAVGLQPGDAAGVRAAVVAGGPVRSLEELVARGVAAEDVARLRPLVTALPGPTAVNLNAAPVELLAVLLGNPVSARVLAARRKRSGFVTEADLGAAMAILPPGSGFTSDHFRVRVAVRIGGTMQSVESLLQRRRGPDGEPEVAVVARQNATAAVSPPPPSG